ncbi:unnamed protein product [Cuscuta campestris]|uniref:RING-type E3 ubiquitin transferase n=1 Tax=Cuscuta campestris TaxID=132261 RepID=A0A484NQ40_9ASTE|nr:unnamed protein product [Cuscuta campestris]
MGNCCCSARKPLLHGAPVFYYYSPSSEEHDSLTSNDSAATGFMADLDLDTSSPDTFSPPPPPIPFDILLGCPQSSDAEDSRKNELERLKSSRVSLSLAEEEDVCPTCLDEYNADHPRIKTKCNHHFHLSCILEWMERRDTCPICNQEMIYEPL